MEESVDIAVKVLLVLWSTRRRVAPGITAPVGSRSSPANAPVAVVWPDKGDASSAITVVTANPLRKIRRRGLDTRLHWKFMMASREESRHAKRSALAKIPKPVH